MKRRQFMQLVAGGMLVTRTGALWAAEAGPRNPQQVAAMAGRRKAPLVLETFDYQGVRLLPGPFADRLAATRAFYMGLSDDDVLKGFRTHAGLAAPGESLGGWCSDTSAVVFGQWLSGMARLYRATGDVEMRDKAIRLMKGWGETMPKLKFGHYDYEKFMCGLVDLAMYADVSEALPLMAQLTDWAEANLGRARLNASDDDSQGGFFNGQLEWYTLSENLYRAYLLTGDERYKSFGDVWRYEYYWGMFNGKTAGTPDGFHGYSHANALNSAAMTYAITSDPSYLKTLTGAYDYFQKTQCYATGGYGPGEKLMRPNGELGRSIAVEPNAKYLGGAKGRSFETPCGTWAVFKLGNYLQSFTGDARYGDWTERVLYNGIGAALPMKGRGQTFYYADYRLGGAVKHYHSDAFPCCSGTYIQDVAALHDILYFKNAEGLFVNQYIPSEVTWNHGGQEIKLTQATTYPETEDIFFMLELAHPATFTLNFRVPEWARGATLNIIGQPQFVKATPGQWLELKRVWKGGEQLVLHIPTSARAVPIDEEHPYRIAYARGPMVLVRPNDVPAPDDNADPTTGMVPFFQIGENGQYQMYFDPPTVPLVATSLANGALWHWTTEKPADNWNATTFDAAAWKESPAPFGTMEIAHTRWDTPDIWLRREVTIPTGPITEPQLLMFYDEDAQVYFNGVLAAQTTGYSTSYEQIELTPAAKALVKPGAKITIAVHVHQTTGSQLIDLGLVDLRLHAPLAGTRKV